MSYISYFVISNKHLIICDEITLKIYNKIMEMSPSGEVLHAKIKTVKHTHQQALLPCKAD